ncbi:MAG: hypothetical protein ACKN9K_07745, partial [Dolichospermum sp.]
SCPPVVYLITPESAVSNAGISGILLLRYPTYNYLQLSLIIHCQLSITASTDLGNNFSLNQTILAGT